MNKLIVIYGPTATGKTKLGLHAAKILNGEIVSADSRQVYKYMDIGTGKDIGSSKFKVQSSKLQSKIPPVPFGTGRENEINEKITVGTYDIDGISIWGLDLVEPDQKFSVAHWLKTSQLIVQDIWSRNKLPIIVGGTGFWIKALIDGVDSIGIPPNWKLRKQLSKYNINELVNCLKKINPVKYEQMNNSDRNNSRRLIRAIEIAYQMKNFQPKADPPWAEKLKIHHLLIIGLMTNNKGLYELIDQRVGKRINEGAEQEVRKLVKRGYNFDLQAMQAPGYKEWKNYFDKKINLNEVIKQWKNNEHKLARNQLTWFKKDKRITWFNIEKSNHKKIANYILRWYTDKR